MMNLSADNAGVIAVSAVPNETKVGLWLDGWCIYFYIRTNGKRKPSLTARAWTRLNSARNSALLTFKHKIHHFKNTKSIIFNTKFIIYNTKSISFDTTLPCWPSHRVPYPPRESACGHKSLAETLAKRSQNQPKIIGNCFNFTIVIATRCLSASVPMLAPSTRTTSSSSSFPDFPAIPQFYRGIPRNSSVLSRDSGVSPNVFLTFSTWKPWNYGKGRTVVVKVGTLEWIFDIRFGDPVVIQV